uniref:Uncharacterized protein n=1 Tax=Meloidogyne enterolobii TaxID=390850 RepID=A0A6V7W7I6_MELEN|nr:unnamed protein product [Meloidogyne enterolobii]
MEWANEVLNEVQVGRDEVVKIDIIKYLKKLWNSFKIKFWKGNNFNEGNINFEIEV